MRNRLGIWLCVIALIWGPADWAVGQATAMKPTAVTAGKISETGKQGEQAVDGLVTWKYSLRNPRAAMMTFIVAMEKRDLSEAIKVIDFSKLDPAPDSSTKTEYARMLKYCIDRIALVDPELISDDPEQKESRFPPGDKGAVIRTVRCADQQWRFSSVTVAELPALFELLKEKPPVGAEGATKSAAKAMSQLGPQPAPETTRVASALTGSSGEPEKAPADRSSKSVPGHLKSARQVMRTLIVSLAEKDYADVVSALDFSKVEQENPDIGPYAKLEMARRLKAVIVRLENFDYGEISDDPNGPEFRFPMHQVNQPISICRGESGAWRFSADTVADIDVLFSLYGNHKVLFLTDEQRPWYRRELVMGNEVWQILLLFGVIFLSLVLGQFVRLTARWRAERLKESGRVMRSLTYETLAKSVPAIALLLGLAMGLSRLTLGFKLEMFTGTILHVMLSVIVGYICFRLVDVIVAFLRDLARRSGSTLNDMLVPIVSTSLRLTVIVLVVLEIATAVSNQPPSAVIAGLGAGGLAVGLAAQDTIKNLFGSVMIFADRPFELGDRIVIDGHDGPVESVGFRSSRIRTLDGHLVTVPNGEMAHKTIHNVGKRPFIRRVMNIRIAYGTAPEKVQQALGILRQLLDHHDGFNEKYPPRVFLHDFLDSAVNIRAIYWYHPPDYWDYCDFGERLNLQILHQFRDADIDFALPAQNLFVSGLRENG